MIHPSSLAPALVQAFDALCACMQLMTERSQTRLVHFGHVNAATAAEKRNDHASATGDGKVRMVIDLVVVVVAVSVSV